MNEPRRIVVALSGGVDSSVAAALLRQQGHTLLGLTLKLAPDGASGQCCGLDGVARARQVCARLDIPFSVVDASDLFRKTVIDPFVQDYAHGFTPNPCVSCNRHVKFDYLFELARSFGFTDVATGHYARITPQAELRRGRDTHKDQSYALYMLRHAQLARLHFPLGDLQKSETRALAASLGLATQNTPESQDICFVGHSHIDYLEKEQPGIGRVGELVDEQGRVLGQHQGLHRYTVGQRHGLGIGGGHGQEGAWYVLHLDPAHNRVVVGPQEHLGSTALLVRHVSTTLPGNDPADLPDRLRVQVRYGRASTPATWAAAEEPGSLWVHTSAPVVAAPGQAMVLYDEDDDRVLGGGTLVKAETANSLVSVGN